VGHATLKVASNKVSEHNKACSDHQDTFMLFTFEKFDVLAPKVVDFLLRVQSVIHSKVMSSMSINIVFKMINFFIQ